MINDMKTFIKDLLFSMNKIPLVKYNSKSSHFLYLTDDDFIGAISFENLTKCMYDQINSVFVAYLKRFYREHAKDELKSNQVETNYRKFISSFKTLLKDVLKEGI